MYSVSVAKITNQVKILFPYFNFFFSIYVFLISHIINTSCGTVALYGSFFLFFWQTIGLRIFGPPKKKDHKGARATVPQLYQHKTMW